MENWNLIYDSEEWVIYNNVINGLFIEVIKNKTDNLWNVALSNFDPLDVLLDVPYEVMTYEFYPTKKRQ